jgi:hypothetical protein
MNPEMLPLVDCLRERLRIIADREFYQRDPAGHLAKLREVSENIVAIQSRLPGPLDPQLQHFLQRCSYDKALDLIENSGSPTSV